MADLYQNKYRIESARFKGDDYNNGYYFVTLCTKDREHTLGEIIDNKINLSPIGEFTLKTISEANIYHPYCSIKSFAIMPNHIHAIIYVAYNVINDKTQNNNKDDNDLTINQHMKRINELRGKLSVVVGAIKSTIKRFANDNDIPFAWQPRFYDHIITNADEMKAIKTYIENNAAKWNGDEYYESPSA